MKLSTLKRKVAENGYALLLAMSFAGVSLLLLSSTMSWTASGSKVTERNNTYNRALAAAEAGTEAVIARMDRDFLCQSLNYANLGSYRAVTPADYVTNGWPAEYEFSDNAGRINQAGLSWTGPVDSFDIDPQMRGLYGKLLSCTVISTAKRFGSPGYDVAAAVQQDFALAAIPIYQFEAFYSLPLEINPGPIMKITGKVHGNSDIYLAPQAGLEFLDPVEAVGKIYFHRMTNDPMFGSSKVDPVFRSTHTEKASSLSLPIGTNNAPSEVVKVLDVPPPLEDPKSPMGAQRFYNKVDLIVTVSPTGVPSVRAGRWNPTYNVPPDVTNNPPTYSFIRTNATFRDSRENKDTIVTDFDVAAFNQWLIFTNSGIALNAMSRSNQVHQLNSVYVLDQRVDPSKMTVVRVVNGQQLPPDGLTVATPLPIYVQGNYNVTDLTPGSTNTLITKPSSLVGDAITVLSKSWDDSRSTNSVMGRPASITTVNAAFLAGIVQTTNISGVKYYSGGLENFPRFLENWSGVTFTYNGSMVVMFPSRYAKSFWVGPSTTTYYQAPRRDWAFDLNFLNPAKLPPVTPLVLKLIRGQWVSVAANTP